MLIQVTDINQTLESNEKHISGMSWTGFVSWSSAFTQLIPLPALPIYSLNVLHIFGGALLCSFSSKRSPPDAGRSKRSPPRDGTLDAPHSRIFSEAHFQWYRCRILRLEIEPYFKAKFILLVLHPSRFYKFSFKTFTPTHVIFNAFPPV